MESWRWGLTPRYLPEQDSPGHHAGSTPASPQRLEAAWAAASALGCSGIRCPSRRHPAAGTKLEQSSAGSRMAWHGMAGHGRPRHTIAQHGMDWHGMAWHSTAGSAAHLSLHTRGQGDPTSVTALPGLAWGAPQRSGSGAAQPPFITAFSCTRRGDVASERPGPAHMASFPLITTHRHPPAPRRTPAPLPLSAAGRYGSMALRRLLLPPVTLHRH